MEEKNENVALLIIGVPREFSLLEFGCAVEKYIGKRNIIASIRWANTNSDSSENVEVKMNRGEDVSDLLKSPVLSIPFKDDVLVLTVTKPRSKEFVKSPTKLSSDDHFSNSTCNEEKNLEEKQEQPQSSHQDDSTDSAETSTTNQQDLDNSFVLKPLKRQVVLSDATKILEYVNKSSNLFNHLQEGCESFAKLTVSMDNEDEEKFNITFHPILSELTATSQTKFNAFCHEAMDTFLSKFISKSYDATIEALKYFKEKYQVSDTGFFNVDKCYQDCFFEWDFMKYSGRVTATGRYDAVEAVQRCLKMSEESYQSSFNLFSRPGTSSKPEIDHLNQRNIHQVTSWSQLIQTDPGLFSEFEDRCIVVQNVSPDCSYEDVRSFFVRKSVSNRGEVKRIIRLLDGHLIAFKEKQSASSVLSRDELNLGEVQLTISPKTIPRLDDRILYLEGNFTKEKVEAILLSLSTLSTSYDIHDTSSPKKFLIIFQNPTDVAEVAKEIENIGLTDTKPKTKQLCYSDCICVTNVGPDISNDRLKIILKKKKYTVTFVRRHEKKPRVLLFFSDYRDVIKQLQTPHIVVDGIQLDMHYYLREVGKLEQTQYAALLESGKRRSKPSTSKFRPKSFCKKFCTTNQDVLTLFTTSKALKADIDENLVGIAQLNMKCSSNKPLKLEASFTPISKQRDPFANQTNFEERCCKVIEDILSTYTSKDVTTLSQGAVRRIQQIAYDKKKKVSLIDTDKLQLLIRWKDDSGGTVVVTGTLSQIKKLKQMYNECNVVLPCSKSEFKLYSDCGIFDYVERECFVKMKKCKDSYNVYTEGTQSDIESVKEILRKEMKLIQSTETFDFLQSEKIRFLRFFSEQPDAKIEEKIREIFQKKKLKASLQLDRMILFYMHGHHSECVQTLQEVIAYKMYPLKEDYYEICSGAGWENIESFVEKSKCLKIFEQDNILSLVGIDPSFTEANHLLDAHLSQSDEKSQIVKIGRIEGKFIQTFPAEAGVSDFLKKVEWHVDEEGVHLQGKQRYLQQAAKSIEKIPDTLAITSHLFDEPWHVKYLTSEAGKQFLECQQKEQQCLITNEEEAEEKEKFTEEYMFDKSLTAISNDSVQSTPRYPVVQLPGTNVIVRLVEGDITMHKVDAIVNTSNKELDLRSAGVSGSILSQGGRSIQDEMDLRRYNLKNSTLKTGNAVTTGSGRLQNCRKIIHVAGPVWYEERNPRQSSINLKKSVTSCLDQADKNELTSIAMPAISCGVFGGEPDQSARLIVEAIAEYFTQKKRQSFLKRVDLIELSNRKIIKAFTSNLNNLSSMQVGASSRQSINTTQQTDFGGPSTSCKVEVKRGNILKTKVNVILNTAGPGFNLEASKLSTHLVEKAGRDIIEECNRRSIREFPKFRITGGGNLPCKFIVHLIIPNEDNCCNEIALDLLKVFQAVDEMEQTTMAIPAIGTGNASMQVEEAVKMIEKSIEMFQESNPKHLKTIEIVIFEKRVLTDYQRLSSTSSHRLNKDAASSRAAVNFAQPSTSAITKSKVGKSVLSSTRKSYSMILKFCSMKKQINQTTLDKIQWRLESKYIDRQIQDIPSNAKIEEFLDSLRKDNDAKMEVKVDEQGNRLITLAGLQEDVNNARKRIEKFIVEFSE